MNAIRALLSLLDEHDDAPGRAQDLMQGPFGRQAADAVREVAEAIASSKARTEAFGAAYERYLPFKHVVRATYGASSARYRRIHIRASGKLSVDDPDVQRRHGEEGVARPRAGAVGACAGEAARPGRGSARLRRGGTDRALR